MVAIPTQILDKARLELLPGVRRTMFSEPLLAHPAEIGGVPPPGTRTVGIKTIAIHAMTRPRMNSIWSRRPKSFVAHNDPGTVVGICLCACAQRLGNKEDPNYFEGL